MKLLFWNLKKNSINNYLIECLNENEIDVAVLAEYSGLDFDYIESVSEYSHIEGFGGSDKITMLVKTGIEVIVKRESSRYVIYHIVFNGFEYNLVGTHLQDRIHTDKEIRILTIGRLVNDLSNLERSSNCNNSMIIGDFNANPFDDELLRISAFNAVLFKKVIEKSETRTVDNKKYRRFYNPILNYLSEDTETYGSYYHIGDSNSPIWHSLDQFIVRKPLMNKITDFRYIKTIDGKSLIKSVMPNKDISDHLPLIVTVLEGE